MGSFIVALLVYPVYKWILKKLKSKFFSALIVVVLFILATRRVVMVGFEKAFLMQHPGIYETADVIATYIYRRGIMGGDYSYGTAIGLLNSLVSFIIVLTVNKLARIVRGEGLW